MRCRPAPHARRARTLHSCLSPDPHPVPFVHASATSPFPRPALPHAQTRAAREQGSIRQIYDSQLAVLSEKETRLHSHTEAMDIKCRQLLANAPPLPQRGSGARKSPPGRSRGKSVAAMVATKMLGSRAGRRRSVSQAARSSANRNRKALTDR